MGKVFLTSLKVVLFYSPRYSFCLADYFFQNTFSFRLKQGTASTSVALVYMNLRFRYHNKTSSPLLPKRLAPPLTSSSSPTEYCFTK